MDLNLFSVRFLPTAFLVCAIVGLLSAVHLQRFRRLELLFWGSVIFGFNDAMTTGAVVSGAFLGITARLIRYDQLGGGYRRSNLFEHIAGMRYTDFRHSSFR